MHHDTEIVSSLRLAIAELVGQDRYDIWFRNTSFELDKESLQIICSSQFAMEWMRNNFRPQLQAVAVQQLGAEAVVQFQVGGKQVRNAGRGDDAFHADHDHNDTTVLDGDLVLANASARVNKADRETESSQEVEPNQKLRSKLDPRTDRVGKSSSQPATSRSDNPATTTNEQPVVLQAVSGSRRYATLDTFVSGTSCQLAATAAEMVARSPGQFSPLFLHGPSGVGKTHLAEGIYWSMRQSGRRSRCLYITAEQFTTGFLDALLGRKGLPSFRHRHRDVDLLVIEDVQFFAGKKATIAELQHTMDSLLRQGKQLVLTADRPPSQLGVLGPELSARCNAGLVAPLGQPDPETRVGVLRHAARQRGLDLSENVIATIAANLTEDVRQLQGALNRILAYQQASGGPLSDQLALESLRDLFQASRRRVRLADIERAVCDVFDVAPDKLKSERKSKNLSHPRMLAMWLARKHTQAPLSEICEHFGRKSHSTVLSAKSKVDHWRKEGTSLHAGDATYSIDEAIRRVEERLQA